jgi:hypothetical protein
MGFSDTAPQARLLRAGQQLFGIRLSHHAPTVTWFAVDETRPPFFLADFWMLWRGYRGTKATPADGDHLLYSS